MVDVGLDLDSQEPDELCLIVISIPIPFLFFTNAPVVGRKEGEIARALTLPNEVCCFFLHQSDW